ncbi:hypothetical protein MicloDRAFT_00013550 [Microvirga lotononidis]|uniref:Uncharacterized protein n=1 Tax=Microvirga lotononidis TaxID=864069 RepID=I4Z1E2_9HYPH|nr:hypothetical protein MicloDRAFT_00013550 [Microvirga lotononidis]
MYGCARDQRRVRLREKPPGPAKPQPGGLPMLRLLTLAEGAGHIVGLWGSAFGG